MNSSISSHMICRLTGCKLLSPPLKYLALLSLRSLTCPRIYSLPGVPATGLKVEIPFTAVVNIRGDRLYHEHIAWDQTTALIQIGLLPEYLPYPYPLPNGRTPATGKKFEYRVPGSGREAAEKMQDKNRVSSNQMFKYHIREVDA